MGKLQTKLRYVFFALVIVSTLTFLSYLFFSNDLALLQPSGQVAEQQKNLLIFAFILSMFVILPVFFLAAFIAIKYRETNKNAKYSPGLLGNNLAESVWWGIPIIIILILSVVTYKTSHLLDPFKPLESAGEPLEVEVVALQWKWMFIYPEQNVATVNYLHIPKDRPINFSITSDAPMNSFWIPKLGGQIYAMSGMVTKLHLEADETGTFKGYSSNLSGEGFSDMNFDVVTTTQNEFSEWINSVQSTSELIDRDKYSEIAQPSTTINQASFKSTGNLFEDIVHKYYYEHDHGITYFGKQDSAYINTTGGGLK